MGIESSAHTFGVGVVKNGRVLANEKSMYKIGKTGMIPNKVAEFHIKNGAEVIQRAVDKAGIEFEDLEGIGYTKGPGIGHCLQVGALSAKTLALRLGVPITHVNHGVGHVEIVKHQSKLKDPLALYVSGGNSQILKLERGINDHYRILGETFDIGVGNMLDNFARELKLEPAWGSTVEQQSIGGKYVDLPYTVKGMDFSFTGLLTAAMKIKNNYSVADLCFSIQEVAYSMLCEATERALLLTNSNELLVCGGVAQSKMLSDMLSNVASDHGAKFGHTTREFDADNGAMIAFVAERLLSHGYSIKIKDCDIQQRYRIDKAVVF